MALPSPRIIPLPNPRATRATSAGAGGQRGSDGRCRPGSPRLPSPSRAATGNFAGRGKSGGGGGGEGKVHQSLLVEQITQCDSERLLSAAKRGCTTLPHRKKPAMRRQCCLTAQAAGRQGPAAAAGWGGQRGGDRGLSGLDRLMAGTCRPAGRQPAPPPKTPCPPWGGVCGPRGHCPQPPALWDTLVRGAVCHGELSKGLTLVARWTKPKF